MAFAKEILEAKKELEKSGKQTIVPTGIENYAKGLSKEEDKWDKIKNDVIKKYFDEIKNCDAVLIINKDKNNIKNYLGGNSLIEMAFAHVLEKKIFLLNPIPEINYSNEIEVMNPIIINKDLTKIK